jgi:hypothetical protein
MIMADVEAMLARREQIGAEITEVVGRLGVLVREESEIEETLRRTAERAGSKANAFSTAPTALDAVCSELARAGINLRRSDPRMRLTAVVETQNHRYRGQMAGREPASGQSAA